MSPDKTPRDPDETLALPVTDADPAPAAADETLALPVTDPEPAPATPGETLALPATDPADDEDRDDRPRPTTSTTSTWSSDSADEPPARSTSAYTSPIGALYAPADRPDPAIPADTRDTVAAEPVTAGPRRRLRVGTVVWGLVIAAIGVGVLAWAGGVEIDVQLAMIVLLAAAGVALLLGSIFSGARNARR